MSKDVGRPTVITPEVVSLLVTSFHNGLTVREACWQSGISHEAYYQRLRSDEEFADTMSKAQSQVTINARTQIASSIKAGDTGLAKWWLERKAKDEFGVKDSLEVSIPTASMPEPELEISLIDAYQQFRRMVADDYRDKKFGEFASVSRTESEKIDFYEELQKISDEEACKRAIEEYSQKNGNAK